MKRKGLFFLTALLSLVLLAVPGCRKYEQVRILSGKLESVKMKGLRGADIMLSVKVDKPAAKILLDDVRGQVKHSGKIVGNVVLAPLTVNARTIADYQVTATVALESGVSLIYLMNFADPKKLKECTIDLSVKGKVAGVRLKRQFKDIPLKKLLEEKYYEKI